MELMFIHLRNACHSLREGAAVREARSDIAVSTAADTASRHGRSRDRHGARPATAATRLRPVLALHIGRGPVPCPQGSAPTARTTCPRVFPDPILPFEATCPIALAVADLEPAQPHASSPQGSDPAAMWTRTRLEWGCRLSNTVERLNSKKRQIKDLPAVFSGSLEPDAHSTLNFDDFGRFKSELARGMSASSGRQRSKAQMPRLLLRHRAILRMLASQRPCHATRAASCSANTSTKARTLAGRKRDAG